MNWPSLSNFADALTIAATVLAFCLYGKAWSSCRVAISEHLDVIGSWCAGPRMDSSGWVAGDVTLARKIEWLDPTRMVYRIGSGPALIQTTIGDTLTLGDELTRSIVHLNQRIESLNSVLSQIDALRASNTGALFRIQLMLRKELRNLPTESDPEDQAAFLQVLGKSESFAKSRLTEGDLFNAATLVLLMVALHTELIGSMSGDGLCAANAKAVKALDRDR